MALCSDEHKTPIPWAGCIVKNRRPASADLLYVGLFHNGGAAMQIKGC